MKKNIIIALIILVGGVLLIYPLLKDDPIVTHTKKENPAEFLFKENLATIYNQEVSIEIKANSSVQRLEVLFNDSVIQSWDNPQKKVACQFNPNTFGVGTKTLVLRSTLEDGSIFVDNRLVRVLSDIIPEKLTVKVVKTYPHNTTSFTQGLEFYNDNLYEGTGDPGSLGRTVVAKVELETGKQLYKMGLPAGFFGEGITILHDTLYQITWQNGKCYMYDVANNLQLFSQEFGYVGEGWGLCNDGNSLIMSDGSERIIFRDPKTFNIQHSIEVYSNKGPVNYLNELEYINGKIYANVWTTNIIVSIDPETGRILQEIDATDLVIQNRGLGEVLNGIAYNAKTNKTYLTGKNWAGLHEVSFDVPGE